MSRLLRMLAVRASARSTDPWPPYNGKNFILSLVAEGLINPRNTVTLAVLFSPGDERYTTDNVDFRRYLDVTAETLASDTDFRELTSYAGRRNLDSEFRIASAAVSPAEPILADGSFARFGIVLLGHTNGKVTELSLRDADAVLPDFDDRIFGEEALVDVLRALSDD